MSEENYSGESDEFKILVEKSDESENLVGGKVTKCLEEKLSAT